MNGSGSKTAQLIDLFSRSIYGATIKWVSGRIVSITPEPFPVPGPYLLPGLVDAHIHIESSMLTPYEFARRALVHGTVATVSDPHEIANVCGMEGVMYMLDNAREAKLKFHFGAPSCVPATAFESAGAELSPREVASLLQRDDIYYLSEMMNFPGVLQGDQQVMEKIAAARETRKPVDGHTPGLTGDDAIAYINAGITTDHECFTKAEALHKIRNGMKILIREGSAARNFEALHELISTHPDSIMFCSDDKHPDELMTGHINVVVQRALLMGHNFFDVLRAACLHPVEHYKMRNGLLRVGDPADFIVIDNPADFNILETWIDGDCVASGGECHLPLRSHAAINHFNAGELKPEDLALPARTATLRVIGAIDGQLVTEPVSAAAKVVDGMAVADVENDILKLVVMNRYRDAKPAIAFIKNFNLKRGAFASTVAHDSHNIIAVGTDDHSLAKAINSLVRTKGGLSVSSDEDELILPLPVAGLMSTGSCDETARLYSALDRKVKEMGCTLRAPFMTLSFMALLVIPSLKLSDRGLFDGNCFEFTEVFV